MSRKKPAEHHFDDHGRIGLDGVLIMQNGDPATLMVIHKPTGKVVKELILPTRNRRNAPGQ